MKTPKYKIHSGSFDVSVWENKDYDSFLIRKSFKNARDEWENKEIYIMPNDVPKLIEMLRYVYAESLLGQMKKTDDCPF